jgi:serine/threonine protein kinase
LPRDQVVEIFDAVAEALDYAHECGLLHRDVKPANILFTAASRGKQRILLADFGIARTLDDISGLTVANMTVGTVSYAAPEQLMDAPVDGRADQYWARPPSTCLRERLRSNTRTSRLSSVITSTLSRRGGPCLAENTSCRMPAG